MSRRVRWHRRFRLVLCAFDRHAWVPSRPMGLVEAERCEWCGRRRLDLGAVQ